MCGETDRKLDHRDRLGRRKKEMKGRRKNAKCPALFCLIDPIRQEVSSFSEEVWNMTHGCCFFQAITVNIFIVADLYMHTTITRCRVIDNNKM